MSINEVLVKPTGAGNNGEIAGSATAAQFPDVPCRSALIKAVASNAGNVYVGWVSGVTKVDGSTDTTTGFELAPGEVLPVEVDNLSRLYYICDNAGDDLTYFTQK